LIQHSTAGTFVALDAFAFLLTEFRIETSTNPLDAKMIWMTPRKSAQLSQG
jgi:hypothetical protein